MNFGTRLERALAARGSLCVGIDPHAALLEKWGLGDDIVSLERFAMTCAEAFGGLAAMVKPQSAFFERFGSAGIAVLERTVAALRQQGTLVLLDVKRGDIGSTMSAYAEAYLDPTADLAVDAITVSPFLGVGSLAPAFDLAGLVGAGVFVLALTSNPEGAGVQHALTETGRTVAQDIIDQVAARNEPAPPTGGVSLGSFGVVVGATIGESVADLAEFNGPFLVPGIGAQGGTAADVRRIFGPACRSVLPSVSRQVLGAGPSLTELRAATERAIAEFAFLRA